MNPKWEHGIENVRPPENGGKERTMKRTSRMNSRLLLGALLLGISLHPFVLPGGARAVDKGFVSAADTGWTVYDTNGTLLGSPQNVCASATSPPHCPTGSTPYGWTAFPIWAANLNSFPPGAKWIWAPNITGTTSSAGGTEFTFERKFYFCGTPKDGAIFVAADDSAEVFLKDPSTGVLTKVLTSPPNTSDVFSTVSIPATSLFKSPKVNTIVVKAKNAFISDKCNTYACNPAGMVFGASLADSLLVEPTCTDPSGKVGDVRNLGPCTSPLMGSKYSACICIGSAAGWFDYDTCMQPPPPCTGYTYSAWSACGTNRQQTRTITGKTPAGCTGTPSTQPVLTWACNPPCTYTYSTWGPCQSNKTQTRTVVSSSPSGCTGTPVLSKSCDPLQLGVGDMCAQTQPNYVEFGVCPAGTTCGSRTTCSEDCPWWDWSGLFCSKTCLVSTDWYCDPK